MSRGLRALRQGIARAITSMARRPATVATVVGTVAAVFLLIGQVLLAERAVAAAASSWHGAQMVVYLDEGTSEQRAGEIRAALQSVPAVERSVYVSPAEALDRLRSVLDRRDELIAGLEPSMMPASIEVALAAGIDHAATAHAIAQRLEATPGVEEVELAGAWVGRATSLVTGLRAAIWVFLALLVAASAYVIATVISALMAARRPEAEVQRLLGATSSFVRGPLILEGALEGAAGAALAMTGLWLLVHALAAPVGELLGAGLGAAPVAFFSAQHIGLAVAAGAALGGACCWVAARRHALG